MRVLAETLALGCVIPAERTLGLRRHGILLTLRTLLLAEVLVIVVEAVLRIRRVVRRELAGGGAQGAAGLLAWRLCRLSLPLEATLKLILCGRGDGRLLAKRLEGLRRGER